MTNTDRPDLPPHASVSPGLLPLGLALVLVLACAPSTTPPASPTVVLPETLQTDGHSFKQVAIEETDERILSRYFAANPAVAENPLLQGQMALYVDERGHRRFYWVYPVDKQNQWWYLEFDRQGRFVGQHEGVGAPFSSRP